MPNLRQRGPFAATIVIRLLKCRECARAEVTGIDPPEVSSPDGRRGLGTVMVILDATLREGEQTPGVCFDQHVRRDCRPAGRVRVDVIGPGTQPSPTTFGPRSRHRRVALRARVGRLARSLESTSDSRWTAASTSSGIFYCVSDRRLADSELAPE
jgi:hypothetical protein